MEATIIYHSLKADAVKILSSVVPDYVSCGPRTSCGPILHLCNLSSASVTSVLIFPLPIDASDDSGAGKDSANTDLRYRILRVKISFD